MKKILFFMPFALLLYSNHVDGFGSLTARSPGTNEAFTPLWLKVMDAKVTLNDQIAVTTVDQTFKNTSTQRKEGIYKFSLPENSEIIELALWIDGKRCVAMPYEKTEAKSVYDNSVRKTVDPALLEKTGTSTYQINIFPIEAAGDSMSERRIDFTYVTSLPKQDDTVHFSFQLKTTEISSTAPQRTSLTIQASMDDSISNISVPGFLSQEINFVKSGKKSFSLSFGNENAYCAKDLALNVIMAQHATTMNVLSYNPGIDTTMYFDSTGDPGYFMVRINTPSPSAGGITQKRNLVFVLDASYSMTGDKFRQLQKAITSALGMLKPDDYFNIISFGTGWKAMGTDLCPASESNISAAKQFVATQMPKGITNPVDALTKAFSTAWNSDSVRDLLFITDGYPTWPVRKSTSSLIDSISAHNGGGARLYSIGIGGDIDDQFLSVLSRRNNGIAVVIEPDDTLFSQLGSIVQQMLYPLFSDMTMNFGGINATEIYPPFPWSAYAGQQFNVFGRYSDKTASRIILSGKMNGKAMADTISMQFPVAGGNFPVIPQLWAASKIDALLDSIKLAGETSERVRQITYLGLRYHIVTPYSSLLVLAADENKPAPLLDNLNKRSADRLSFSIVDNHRSSKIRINYSIPITGMTKQVSLKVYDIRGRLVRTIVQSRTQGGHFIVFWDKCTDNGLFTGPGVFILVLEADNQRLVKSLRIIGK